MQAALVTVHNSGQCEAFWQGSALWRGLSSTTLTQAPAGSSAGRFRLWVCKPVGNPGKASGSSGSSGGRHRLWVYGASGQPWKGPSCLCRDQDQASAFPDPTHGLSVCLGVGPEFKADIICVGMANRSTCQNQAHTLSTDPVLLGV